jgi:hypothetical protein
MNAGLSRRLAESEAPMRRGLLVLPLLATFAGCGVNVNKPTGAGKAPAPEATPQQTEVYDKVAPMPREVK